MKLIAQRRGTRFILKHRDHTEDVQVSQSGRTTCVRTIDLHPQARK